MKKILASAMCLVAVMFVATFGVGTAFADTCVGHCGVLGANGVVTASPLGGTYQYVTTAGGAGGAGEIPSVGGTDGSSFTTTAFAANAGSSLDFYFNYITADGAGFSDYGWAALVNAADQSVVAYLFTARTTTVGNTSPGFGLPADAATLTPAGTPIIGGAPVWSPLGSSSGYCYSSGCGYTGWIGSDYSIGTAGNYELEFGVTNWGDTAVDTGLAFDGLTVDGAPIETTPEPSALLLLGFGLTGLAAIRRKMSSI